MSLSVYLIRDMASLLVAADFLEEHGMDEAATELRAIPADTLFEANITHNLNTMADKVGIYKHLWRPEELGITKAHQLIKPLKTGLALLECDPETYKHYNPTNGWGNYEGLVEFVRNYLEACEKYPQARIEISR